MQDTFLYIANSNAITDIWFDDIDGSPLDAKDFNWQN